MDGEPLPVKGSSWFHRIGSFGEKLKIYEAGGAEGVLWESIKSKPNTTEKNPTGVWYKSKEFVLSNSMIEFPLALNLTGLGKGMIFINGFNLGRHYNIKSPDNGACDTCNYRGASGMLLKLVFQR